MNAIHGFRGEYRWLSNFWASDTGIEMDGELYTTVEHAYQAAKTVNLEARKPLQRVLKPGEAKRMGRGLPLRGDWERVKLDVMLSLLRKKFTRDPDMREKLLATGDAEIVEDNDWEDTFWGVCRGKGSNHLGKLIMQVRRELTQGESQQKSFRYIKLQIGKLGPSDDIVTLSDSAGTHHLTLRASPGAMATDLRAAVRWLERLQLEAKKPWVG